MGEDKLQVLFGIICDFHSRSLLFIYIISSSILIFAYCVFAMLQTFFSPGLGVSFINFSVVNLLSSFFA